MTREERLKMLLHPEQYTDEQIDRMLDDTDISTPDALEQWQHFEAGRHRSRRTLARWAAIVIGVLMLSGISYAAIHILNNSKADKETAVQTVEAPSQEQQPEAKPEERTDTIPQTRFFENVPLDEMVSEIARYYHKEVDNRNAETHKLRLYYKWERKDALESVIDDLNHFDHVNLAIEDDKLIVK